MSVPPSSITSTASPGSQREAPLPQLVDQLGELDQAIQAGRKAEEQARPLKKRLVERLNLGPDESCVVDGNKYQCVISEQQNQREIIDMATLFGALGEEQFLEHCSFPLAKVDELLGDDANLHLKSDRTGPRKYKLIRFIQSVRKTLKKAA